MSARITYSRIFNQNTPSRRVVYGCLNYSPLLDSSISFSGCCSRQIYLSNAASPDLCYNEYEIGMYTGEIIAGYIGSH